MSWQAQRFDGCGILNKQKEPNQRRLPRRRQTSLTQHHVPPSSVCKDPAKQFVLMKSWKDHQAYNVLFGNPRSFSKAVRVLKAYRQLFGECRSFDEAVAILKKHWWSPPAPDGSNQTPN